MTLTGGCVLIESTFADQPLSCCCDGANRQTSIRPTFHDQPQLPPTSAPDGLVVSVLDVCDGPDVTVPSLTTTAWPQVPVAPYVPTLTQTFCPAVGAAPLYGVIT